MKNTHKTKQHLWNTKKHLWNTKKHLWNHQAIITESSMCVRSRRVRLSPSCVCVRVCVCRSCRRSGSNHVHVLPVASSRLMSVFRRKPGRVRCARLCQRDGGVSRARLCQRDGGSRGGQPSQSRTVFVSTEEIEHHLALYTE